MIKIKVTCNWTSNDEIKKRLIDQFGNKESLEDIQITTSGNEYDILIAFGYITEPPINNKPIFVFPQEPIWSGGHQRYFNDFTNVKVFGFDKINYTPIDVVIESVAYMFYGGRGPWEEGDEFWTYNNLIDFNINKAKGICSFVSNRGLNEELFPKDCLYKERTSLINNIYNKLPFVDFYGWGNYANLKPHISKKWEALKDYKFCLTIENSYDKNYISEKFYDCILTNTIPIYYGCPNIKDYWPQDGYILLENIKNYSYIEDKFNWINENQEELYNQMLPNLLNMKQKYFDEFNLIKKIKKEYYAI